MDTWMMSEQMFTLLENSRSFIQFLLFKFLALSTIEAREIISPLPSFSINITLKTIINLSLSLVICKIKQETHLLTF